MKKIIATILATVILTVSVFLITAFAWKTPELMLAADYNADKQTVTVYYRVLDFAGTESADFRLKYDPNVLKFEDYEAADIENVLMEIAEVTDTDKIAIQFVDLYYVTEEDCEEDGSATIAKITFKVTDTSAAETVFIATTDSYYMDPDSTELSLDRATLKISLNDGSVQKSTDDSFSFESETAVSSGGIANITKIIIAAVVMAVVFIAGLVVVVIKYRKS